MSKFLCNAITQLILRVIYDLLLQNNGDNDEKCDAKKNSTNREINDKVRDHFGSAAVVSQETITMEPWTLAENNSNEKLEVQDKETNTINDEGQRNVYSSLLYIVSMILFITVGWISGYLSFNGEPIMTISILAIATGVVLGWYIDNNNGNHCD